VAPAGYPDSSAAPEVGAEDGAETEAVVERGHPAGAGEAAGAVRPALAVEHLGLDAERHAWLDAERYVWFDAERHAWYEAFVDHRTGDLSR